MPGHQLSFCLRQVEGQAVGFTKHRDNIYAEGREERDAVPQARLGLNDSGRGHGARHEEHGHQ